MMVAYGRLHWSGYAHSVECWHEDKLVGGLYGISLGSCFFGESMFSTMSGASKVALLALVDQLKKWKFTLIDCQIYSEHLERLGARDIPRKDFLSLLETGVKVQTRAGQWSFEDD
jgi:leucyl/phenylalanyl-tRNA--protein transferase